MKLELLQILWNTDQSREPLHNGSTCYSHHPAWQNQSVALYSMFTSSYEALKKAATSPSQASDGKLVGLYGIKNGVTLKFSTSEQIVIVNNQKSSQTLGPSRGSWSAHLSAVAALLVQQCCSKHVSRGCLQLFTDFRQVQF